MYLRRIGKTDCVPNGSHVGAKVVFSFFKGAFKVFYLWKWDMFHRLLFLHVCYRNVEWSSVVLPMDFVCQNIEFGFQPVRHLTRPSFFYLLVSMNDFPRNVCTCGGKNYWVRRMGRLTFDNLNCCFIWPGKILHLSDVKFGAFLSLARDIKKMLFMSLVWWNLTVWPGM